MKKVVAIGTGVGGLTSASLLAKAGLDMTVLEAQIDPGDCTSIFYHEVYQFDARQHSKPAFTLGVLWIL